MRTGLEVLGAVRDSRDIESEDIAGSLLNVLSTDVAALGEVTSDSRLGDILRASHLKYDQARKTFMAHLRDTYQLPDEALAPEEIDWLTVDGLARYVHGLIHSGGMR